MLAAGGTLERGNRMAELSFIGEGYNGEYDPSDPDDVPLLRFDLYEMIDGAWEALDDCSYCTALPATVSEYVVGQALDHILNATEGVERPKKVCESLSWMDEGWFEPAPKAPEGWGIDRPCVVILTRDNSAETIYGPFESERMAREWMDHQFSTGLVKRFGVVHLRTPFRERTRDDWWSGDWHQVNVAEEEFPSQPWFRVKGWKRWQKKTRKISHK